MSITITNGDCIAVLQGMPAASVDCVVTSPPYNLKKPYSLHNDNMPEATYLAWQGNVAKELRRVMKPDGHVFLNVGWNSEHPCRSIDVFLTYRPYFVLQNQIAWVKSLALDASSLPDDLKTLPVMKAWLESQNLPASGPAARSLCQAMREEMHGRTFGHFPSLPQASVFLNPCWEDIWHLTPTGRSPVDRLAIGVPYTWKDQPGRFGHGRDRHCRGNVWHLPYATTQSREDRFRHPSPYPVELVVTCLQFARLAPDALVLDPFVGIGNSLLAAKELGLSAVGVELDPAYCLAAQAQLDQAA